MTTTIRIEGGLLSPDLLERLPELDGQKPKDFGMDAHGSFVDQVTSVYADAQTYWKAFERRRAHAAQTDESVTTITRDQWVIPLLEALGYQLTFQRRAAEVDGRSFAISHRASQFTNQSSKLENEADELPVHIVGYDLDLGSRPPAGRGTLSPHGLMQDYLNRTEHLWGIVTNGFVLRLLRDSAHLTRPSYIEFDLKQMLEGGRLDEFILFYRLAQRTRLPNDVRDADECWLEKYHQQAIEQGGRIREGLREAVEQTIVTLANGFLAHPHNDALRAKIRDGKLEAREYYRQLLYLIYRLLFLFVAEERNLLIAPADAHARRDAGFDAARFYREQFSVMRLRALAGESLTAPERFDDLYLGLQTLFYALANEQLAAQLGLAVLNGELFAELDDLDKARLTNRDVLQAIAQLAYFTPKDEKVRRRVNYAALDVEELGSVYESLLDYEPVLTGGGGASTSNSAISFRFAEGTERKSTGSYYTAPQLVNELIASALLPVLHERLAAARTNEDKRRAILEMSVIDPAAGSGHFLLAAARALGRELAKIDTVSEEPSPEATRLAIRQVITHCIYGVDKNPRAVDLCKVALWLEGHSPDKPLTFLDHHIRNGDSLVGVRELAALQAGIPDEAFAPVAGDDHAIAKMLKKLNREERKQRALPLDAAELEEQPAAARKILNETSDDTAPDVRKKREAFREWQAQSEPERRVCDLWTAAFFVPLTRENWEDKRIPTTGVLDREMETGNVDRRYNAMAQALAQEPAHKFFHWALEFPEVFARGGFDVVLGNPPWERIKLQEQEFFGTREAAIASAPNKAARQKLIDALPKTNPALWREFQAAKHAAEATSKFVRGSGCFPLTAVGDVNTYVLFTEHARALINGNGRVGIIVPTGIATDDTNKSFFASLQDTQALAVLYDFENREALFPGVHCSYKFCLLTLSGKPVTQGAFVFFATRVEHIRESQRRFTLSPQEIALFNPNTRTMPIFRTRADAELTRKIYERVPVLENESQNENAWQIRFMTMFHMANDSGLFSTHNGDGLLPLYEAKMMWQFDHRWATYERGETRDVTIAEKSDANFTITPRYWVDDEHVMFRTSRVPPALIDLYKARSEQELGTLITTWLAGYHLNRGNEELGSQTLARIYPGASANDAALKWFNAKGLEENYPWTERHTAAIQGCTNYVEMAAALIKELCPNWLIGFRDVTNATNERTCIFSLLPITAVGHKIPLIFFNHTKSVALVASVVANMNSLILDYIARQKIGGVSMSYFILRQLPVLPPQAYTAADTEYIAPRVLELVYTAWDLQPFRWDEERRAHLRAELDAYYTRLYGLTRDELRYILDPKEVYGEDFPGETFRVLKDKEMKLYGEYRTRRLVLEKWDEMWGKG